MKLARIRHNEEIRHAVVENDVLHLLSGDMFGPIRRDGTVLPLADVKLLAPVQPRKLVCVGLNYRLHAQESDLPIPDEPMLFMCSPEAVIGDGEKIVLSSYQDRIDFEAEIAVVVGRQARNVKRHDAADYILGYTCANDVSNRNLQRKDGQFTRAKSFDTYKPLGPWVETELDPGNVGIRLWQNGELRQSSNTNDSIFSPFEVFEFVSGIMTLLPGDVIVTGTPSGVGPLRAGDRIEIEIEGIGRLKNMVA